MFVLAYDNAAGNDQVSIDSFKKYFLPRVKIENYNIEIDGRSFYDQSISDSIKQYDKIRQDKVMITRWLHDYMMITRCWFKPTKALDADPRAIQQIIFTGKIKSIAQNTRVIIYYILEFLQSKEKNARILQRNSQNSVIIINCWMQ